MELRDAYSGDEFAALITGETDYVERKSGLGTDPLQEALVAFSNAGGGVIFVGVADDGRVVGRQHEQGVEDRIHEIALAARNVGRYEIRPVRVDDRQVVAIAVQKRVEGFAQTSNGRVLVRRGARNVALFGADLADFIQARALRRFESTPSGVSRASIDSGFVAELCDAFDWDPSSVDLDSRLHEQGLLTSEGDLTIAGALFLTDPKRSLRQNKAIVEVRRYPDGAEYDRRVEFTGPAHRQVRDATRFVMEELGTDLVVTGLYRHDLPRLPEVVVREAIANAVAHRDYEAHRTPVVIELRTDSVVVRSPGGLPEPVTVATLRQAQAARNQDVINVLRRFRLAEDAGRGIDVIEDTMSEALLDPPRFSEEEEGSAVQVVLPLRGPITPRERAWVADLERRGEISGSDRLLLVHAARGEQLTNRVARTVLGVTETQARAALQRLRDANLLVQRSARGGSSYSLVREIAPPAAYRLSPEELKELVLDEASKSPLSNERVRNFTGLDREQTLRLLRELVRSGRLRRTGARRGTRYEAV